MPHYCYDKALSMALRNSRARILSISFLMMMMMNGMRVQDENCCYSNNVDQDGGVVDETIKMLMIIKLKLYFASSRDVNDDDGRDNFRLPSASLYRWAKIFGKSLPFYAKQAKP
jgi:hypothetical protein